MSNGGLVLPKMLFIPLETPVTHILPIGFEGSRQEPALPPRTRGFLSPEPMARLPPFAWPQARGIPPWWTERAVGSLLGLQMGFLCPFALGAVSTPSLCFFLLLPTLRFLLL